MRKVTLRQSSFTSTVHTAIVRALELCLAVLVPDQCPGCGTEEVAGGYCGPCAAALPRHGAQCRMCGVPFEGIDLCGRCQRRPPPVARTIAPFRYESPVSDAIHKLKYHRALACGRDLGLLLARELTRELARDGAPRPEALVPVPLHWRRQFWRGFNQSQEIAVQVSERLDIPVMADLVERRFPTTPQVGLKPTQRRRNIRGAFVVHGKTPAHVAIVDDVVTSGATVSELARCLRRAGCREISVWAVTRV